MAERLAKIGRTPYRSSSPRGSIKSYASVVSNVSVGLSSLTINSTTAECSPLATSRAMSTNPTDTVGRVPNAPCPVTAQSTAFGLGLGGYYKRKVDTWRSQAHSATSNLSGRSANPAQVGSDSRLQIQPPHIFVPGLIIRGYLSEEAVNYPLNSTAAQGNPTASIFDIGGGFPPLCVKFRYFIVTAAYTHSYSCIPIFSHNKKGISGKPLHYQDEYVSLWDHRSLPDGDTEHPLEAQGNHRPLVTANMHGRKRLDGLSTAWLAYPVARRYGMPVIVEGCLNRSSLNNLQKLMSAYAPGHEQ